jgi:hypothetical protein
MQRRRWPSRMALERGGKEGMNEGEGEGQEEVGNKIVERRRERGMTGRQDKRRRGTGPALPTEHPKHRAPNTEHRTPEPEQGQHFIFLNK